MDVVERTWDELGYRIRPLKYWVFVRTEPPYRRTEGGVWLPHKQVDFYGGLPHKRVVKGVVCAVGPTATVKVGERVCFQRLHFASRQRMADGTHFGWIDCNQLLGYPEDDDAEERWLQGGPAPVDPEVAAEYTL